MKEVVERAASSIFSPEVKMETAGSSRTLSGVMIYQAAQCYNPEGCNLCIQNCRHLISHYHSHLLLPYPTGSDIYLLYTRICS